MKVKVLEDNKNKLVLQVKGEGHAFCNALEKELWNDKHVKVAAYKIEHPLVGTPTVFVETDGKETPKKALIESAKRLGKLTNNFKSAFLKGVK
jgi:DNA-directed RNA polymerase subunit L